MSLIDKKSLFEHVELLKKNYYMLREVERDELRLCYKFINGDITEREFIKEFKKFSTLKRDLSGRFIF